MNKSAGPAGEEEGQSQRAERVRPGQARRGEARGEGRLLRDTGKKKLSSSAKELIVQGGATMTMRRKKLEKTNTGQSNLSYMKLATCSLFSIASAGCDIRGKRELN